MSITFNKFNPFVANIANGLINLASDQLTVALTDVVPVATNNRLTDLTEIAYTNLSTRNVTTTSSTQTSGTEKLICQPLTLTASGNVAQFRYIVLYDNTSAIDNLIGWFDNGSEVNLTTGQQYIINFDTSAGVLTIV